MIRSSRCVLMSLQFLPSLCGIPKRITICSHIVSYAFVFSFQRYRIGQKKCCNERSNRKVVEQILCFCIELAAFHNNLLRLACSFSHAWQCIFKTIQPIRRFMRIPTSREMKLKTKVMQCTSNRIDLRH